MKRSRKWTAHALILSFMLPLVAPFFTLFPERTSAEELNFDNAHITPYQNRDANGNVEGPPTVRYAIGFMTLDLWRNSAGQWSPTAPDVPFGYGILEWPYNLPFGDRIVRDYEVFKFDPNNPEHIEFFNNSRAGTNFSLYEEYISPVSSFDVIPIGNGGIGTNAAVFKLRVAGTPSGEYIELPCEGGKPCNPPVEGRRYYFPIGFKFELDGQKRVRLFDKATGNRIEYQGSKEDIISNMQKNTTVTTDVPQIPGYRYVGYKKKTYITYWPGGNYGEPDGDILPGAPPSFVYDGTFDTYIVHLYYEPDTIPDKPDLVALDITANGPIEVGKPASFTAKWRLEHKSLQPNQCYNVKVMEGATNLKIEQFCGTQQGQLQSMNFTYTFTSTEQKTFLLVVDSANAIDELSEDNNQVSRSFTAVDPNKNFTGDFDVLPSVIAFRDPFELRPKNFVFNGCTYDGHRYKIERDGSSVYTTWANSQNIKHTYSYGNYPWIIGVGTHAITLEIRTMECGTAPVATHTLIVNGPTSNRPPEFKVAWVRPGTNIPVTQVFEGEVLDLVYIVDPSVPTPVDPDGDPLEWRGFDFSVGTNLVRSIPSVATPIYTGWAGIKMTELGTHLAKGMMCDIWGACSTQSAIVQVINEDPVPVITAPLEVVEDRPVTPPINGDHSYSPIPGRWIDHSRDIWTNRRTVYPDPGTEIITLEVFDNTGRKSAAPAVHYLTVKPDLPPVPQLEYVTPTIRNIQLMLAESSYSPDRDEIVERRLTVQYDADNDGNFEEEAATVLPLDAERKAYFTPERVGKYRFTLYVREDWGREATRTYDLEVVNDAPTFRFNVSYEEKDPFVSPLVPLSASSLVENANWRNMDFAGEKPKSWGVNPYTGALAHTPMNLGSGRWPELYVNTVSPSAGGYAVYPFSGDYVVEGGNHNWFYLGDGAMAWNLLDPNASYDTTRYRIYIKSQTYVKYIDREWVIRFDEHNRVVYTVDPVTRSVFRKYALDDFVRPGGAPYATVDARTAGYAQKAFIPAVSPSSYETAPNTFNAIMTSSYGYFACTAAGLGKRFMVYGWDGALLHEGANNSCPFPYGTGMPPYHDFGYDRFANAILAFEGQLLRFGGRNGQPSVIGTYAPQAPPLFFLEDGVHYYARNDQNGLFHRYPEGAAVSKSNVPVLSYRDRAVVDSFYLNSFLLRHDAAGYRYEIVNNPGQNTSRVVRIGRDGTTEILVSDLNEACAVVGSPYCLVTPLQDGSLFVRLNARYFVLEPNRKQDDGYRVLDSLQQLAGDIDSSNVELSFQIRFNTDMNQNLYAGFGYNIQDHLNMYRVELNAWRIRLVRLAGGHKTVLASVPVNVPLSERQMVKIRRFADKHIVYFNGVPVIDVSDSAYTGGTFGPFSEIFKTEFFNMAYRDLSALGGTSMLQGVGIVGEPLQYHTQYDDPENDPRIPERTSWTYIHADPHKFLDAGDGRSGLSAHHNRTYTAEQPVLDKVGVYELSAKTMDDPHPEHRYPDSRFDDFRKESNTAKQTVIIHRRPVSDFDLSVAPDGTVVWTDRSYDPDRWLSDTTYSTEPTGIDYRATRGIVERKYYYITPSGGYVPEKLVVPQELGMYEVGMAVKDEYGAWSDYHVEYVTIGVLPAPNEPPHAGFTVSSTIAYRGNEITIDSTAWDREDGGRENLPHEYYIANVNGGAEMLASMSRTSWTKTFSSIGSFRIRQVVMDSLGQIDQAVQTVTILNRRPIATVLSPASGDPANPTRYEVRRPTFAWLYSDADGDPQTQFQVQIYRLNGALERDTGVRSGSSGAWTPAADLPERVTMYVRVRVHDGYDWSDWSAPKYFFIETNRPPVADFDWTPKPVYEGDTVQLLDRSSDPDGDMLTYDWRITGPGGLNLAFTSKEPAFRAERPGVHAVRLTVGDGKATAQANRTIDVLPLGITAQVTHTDKWTENRAAFNNWLQNQMNAGKITQTQFNADYRNDSDFWAGERFVLNAQTTTIESGSNVTATAVWTEVSGSAYPTSPQSPWYLQNNLLDRQLSARNSGRTIWYGEVNDPGVDLPNVDPGIKLEQLQNGYLDFTFFVRYSNGTVKQTTVRVYVKNKWTEFYRLHRVQ